MSTIRSSREIDGVFRIGRRAAGPLLIALVADTPPGRDPSGRVAFVAGKRLGNAVHRNRAKRLLRVACREAGGPWRRHDVVLIAKPALLDKTSVEATESLRRVMERADLSE